MPDSYLAITLGPIYKTIKQARSTREIWSASYIFSIIMREIIYAADAATIGELLSPLKLELTDHRFGAGIYPDRAFWKLKDNNKHETLSQLSLTAFKEIEKATKIQPNILEDYIRLYAIKLEKDNTDETNIILELNQLLDNLELQEKITNPKPDLLSSLVSGIQNLYKDGHQNLNEGSSVFINYNCNSPLIRLPSIIEIATSDLRFKHTVSNTSYSELVTEPISSKVCEMIKSGKKRNEYNAGEEVEQETIIQLLKEEYKKDFRFRHKYIAFIKADGDNMGTALKLIGNNIEAVIEFSKLLSGFAKEAAELIFQYGGLPIYAGGDDLLFTLPLVNNNEGTINAAGKNIFELIDKVDKKFPAKGLAKLTGDKVTPSISYGISFSYYKYPMDETLEAADQSLYRAKDFPYKNAVAFQVRKHSGQTYSACFPKGEAYKKFFEMMSKFVEFNDDAFLASVMYKLIQLKPLLGDALINNRMSFFFDNQFNEKDHRGKFKAYLEDVRLFADEMLKEYKYILENDPTQTYFSSINDLTDKVVNTLYSCLRFIQFINQKDHA